MRILLGSIVATGLLTLATVAFSQSSTTTPPANDTTAAAVPVALSKRLACRTATQGMQAQERQDQMQLCMAEAHLDCLRQAIGQKIVGPERKDFVRTCVEQ